MQSRSGHVSDRTFGKNWPYYQSEQDLAILRNLSRDVSVRTPNGRGLLNGLVNFIVGKNITYKAKAKKEGTEKQWREQIAIAQDILDEFLDRNDFQQKERELVRRYIRDGEMFLRIFPHNRGVVDMVPNNEANEMGRTAVRFIEPDYIRQPGLDAREWSFGIRTLPNDVCTVLEYYVMDPTTGQGERVEARSIYHLKGLADSTVKRGLPAFSFGLYDALQGNQKLIRNLHEGARIQSAIAAIRQHATASKSQIEQFATDLTTLVGTIPDIAGNQVRKQPLQPGSILDIDAQQNYVPPPAWSNIPGFLEICQACVRSACAAWNAPEWLASADASNNNYASSLTAENPFVKTCEAEQGTICRVLKKIMNHVLLIAADGNKIDKAVLPYIDVQVEAPYPQSINNEGFTNRIISQVQNKIRSPQQAMQDLGLDPEKQMAMMDEWTSRFGQVQTAWGVPGLNLSQGIGREPASRNGVGSLDGVLD